LVLFYFLKSINFQRISIPSYLKESLKFSWKLHIGSLAFFLIYRVDMFLIVFITNDMKALGFYAIAVGVAEKIDTIPSVIASVLFPRVTTLERGEIRKYGPTILRITLCITSLLGLSLALVSYPLVTLLFGTEYEASVLSLCILLVGAVLLGGGRILSSELSGQGKTGIISVANSVGLAINIVLNLLWIPKWGISGAAAATSVTYGTMFAIELMGASRLAGLSIFEYVIPRLSDFSEIRKRLFGLYT
jgi:O-antigen/teichoic acid export membrane protein